jgi:hypothetical protein
MHLFLILICVATFVAVGHSYTWHQCDDPKYSKIYNVTLFPFPVIKGDTCYVTVDVELCKSAMIKPDIIDVPVKNGSYITTQVWSEKESLLFKKNYICGSRAHVICPVGVGRHKVTMDYILQIDIPPSTYDLQVKMYNTDSNQIGCLWGNIDIN